MPTPTIVHSAVSGGGAEVGTALTTVAAAAINASTGNTILVYVRFGAGTFTNVTDTAGNTYTAVPGTVVSNGGIGTSGAYIATRITGNAANVVQANASVGMTWCSIHVLEIANVGAVDVSNGTGSGSVATTMTSTAFTTHSAPELVTVFGTTAGVAMNNSCTVGGSSATLVTSTTAAGAIDAMAWQISPAGILAGVTATDTMASATWNMLVVTFSGAAVNVTVREDVVVTDDAEAFVPQIVPTDIEFRGSGASNLGGAIAAVLTGGVNNNLWDDVTAGESTAGDTEYRCIYIRNNHPFTTWLASVVWIDAMPTVGTIAIGVDSAALGATAVSASANETTPPSPTITFASPITKADGLVLGDIPAQSYQAIWIRRTIPVGNTTAASDWMSLRVEVESP